MPVKKWSLADIFHSKRSSHPFPLTLVKCGKATSEFEISAIVNAVKKYQFWLKGAANLTAMTD